MLFRVADALVILWWIAAVVALPWTLLFVWRGWRRRQLEKHKIALAALNGGPFNRLSTQSMPTALIFLLGIVGVFSFIFIWIHTITWLQVINFYIEIALFG